MGKVISIRNDKNLKKIIQKFSIELKADQSDIIRDLINNGSIYLAIKGYVKGKYFIGKAANLANLPLSKFMDLIMELGIKSKIGLEEVPECYENLKKYF